MLEHIEFTSKGLLCRGWLYVPDSLNEEHKAPAIIMAHGFAGVKEMGLSAFRQGLIEGQLAPSSGLDSLGRTRAFSLRTRWLLHFANWERVL